MEIQLTKGFVALVDAEDFDALSCFKWHAHPAAGGHVYAARCEKGRGIFMHRQITCATRGRVVDHINGHGLDNRRSNLRVCSHAENIANSRIRRDSTSGARCVSVVEKADGTKRFKAYAYPGGKCKSRLFDSLDDAKRWADEMRASLFGEYAYSRDRDVRAKG